MKKKCCCYVCVCVCIHVDICMCRHRCTNLCIYRHTTRDTGGQGYSCTAIYIYIYIVTCTAKYIHVYASRCSIFIVLFFILLSHRDEHEDAVKCDEVDCHAQERAPQPAQVPRQHYQQPACCPRCAYVHLHTIGYMSLGLTHVTSSPLVARAAHRHVL